MPGRIFSRQTAWSAVLFSTRQFVLPLTIFAVLGAAPALAFDAGSAWGTTGSSGGHTTFLESSATHSNSGTSAVYSENGRDSVLPGATINSIGVFNQFSIVGDDNTVTSDQSGTNSGDVTSDTSISYDQRILPLEQTLFPEQAQ